MRTATSEGAQDAVVRPGSAVMLGTKEFPGIPEAVAAARGYVGGMLTGQTAEDAVLCTSELVTNAYKYTRSRDGTITLVVLDLGHGLRIEVIDEGGSQTSPEVHIDPKEPAGDPHPLTGRGLFLVEQITDRWGSQANEVGRVTWFEVTYR